MVHLAGFPRDETFNTPLILLGQIAPKRDTARRGGVTARDTAARIRG
jgi:hypothetical protein